MPDSIAPSAISQSCVLPPYPSDDPLLQRLDSASIRATPADGLAGMLGMYEVSINGQTRLMTRQDLASMQICVAPASNQVTGGATHTAPVKRTVLPTPNPPPIPQTAAASPAKEMAATGSAAGSAPAKPVSTPKQRAAELVNDMLDVIEEVHVHGFMRLDVVGSPRQQAIAAQFVAIGETASGRTSCSAKVDDADRQAMFDFGASIVASKIGGERAFGQAAMRGDQRAQVNADRQVHAWADGSQSTRPQRAAYLQRVEVERTLRTLSNIEGGLGGALGAAIGGHEGSDMGAAIDGVVTAVGGTYQNRANMQTATGSEVNRPRMDPPSSIQRSAPEKLDQRYTQPGPLMKELTSGYQPSGNRSYWQRMKPQTPNPMDGRPVGTRGITDISTARKGTDPALPGGSGSPKPSGSGAAANDNQTPGVQQRQVSVPRRMAVGDNTPGDTHIPTITASTKKPGSGGTDGPREPKFLRDLPKTATDPAANTKVTPSTAAPAPTAASKQSSWTAGELMGTSRYRATQRVVYRGTVDKMAEAMKSKTFDWSRADGDPIIVDSRGKILQGHHRIMAATLAHIPIPQSAIRVLDNADAREIVPWDGVTLRSTVRPASY